MVTKVLGERLEQDSAGTGLDSALDRIRTARNGTRLGWLVTKGTTKSNMPAWI